MALQRFENFQEVISRLQGIQRPRLKDRGNPLEDLTDREFTRRYRLQKQTVIFCVNLIKDDIVSSTRRGCQLPAVLQFCVALRFYACGAFQIVVGDLNNLSQGTISNIVKRVSRAFASKSKAFIRWPREDEADLLRQKFYAIAQFPGIVGAIDCTHVEIDSPGGPNAELFRNRKTVFSINFQAVCTADLEFANLVARWYGSAHDTRIYDNSSLSKLLENRRVPWGLVGDGGYALHPYLMTPFEKPKTNAEKRYNNAQTRTRNPIERAFGVLKRRFACLKKLRLKVKNVLPVIVSTAMLHNISRRFLDTEFEGEDSEEEEDDTVWNTDVPNEIAENVRRGIVISHFTVNGLVE